MILLDLPASDDQTLLQRSLERFMADNPSPSFAELSNGLGLAGLTLPEDMGGFGGGMIEIAMIMSALAPALAADDWLSHTVATMLIGLINPRSEILPRLAAGTDRAAIIVSNCAASMPRIQSNGQLLGRAALVQGAAEADWLLIASEDAIAVVTSSSKGVSHHLRAMRDGSIACDIVFDGPDLQIIASGGQAGTLTDFANDVVLLGRCAEGAGLMQRMLRGSTDHMQQRKQFGVPLGSFQALRHRLADMHMATMKATALTETALFAILRSTSDHRRLAAGAALEIADAMTLVGESAVQIHGAMGLTEELELGGIYKRALRIAAGMGPKSALLSRYTSP